MKQTIISVIGPSGCGKSQYINPIVRQLRNNGYTVEIKSLTENHVPQLLKTLNSEAQFVILHIGTLADPSMRIDFHDRSGPMDLIGALYEKHEDKSATTDPAHTQPQDDEDLDDVPLGSACDMTGPDCESCQ